jgi:hypothetical protein
MNILQVNFITQKSFISEDEFGSEDVRYSAYLE